MKFKELRAVFNGWLIRIITSGEAGEAQEEISLLNAAYAEEKLAKYDEADVARFTSSTMEWNGEEYPALEVVLDV